jgi:hypothetical protein
VSTKFVQIKALGLKLALLRRHIQVSDFRAIMALLFIDVFLSRHIIIKDKPLMTINLTVICTNKWPWNCNYWFLLCFSVVCCNFVIGIWYVFIFGLKYLFLKILQGVELTLSFKSLYLPRSNYWTCLELSYLFN